MEACRRDLGKPPFETAVGEVGWCQNEIIYVCNNLGKWMRDEKAEDIALRNIAMRPRIRKEPLGTVVVIGCVPVASSREAV